MAEKDVIGSDQLPAKRRKKMTTRFSVTTNDVVGTMPRLEGDRFQAITAKGVVKDLTLVTIADNRLVAFEATASNYRIYARETLTRK